ncbi:MAG: MFS transporter [Candidatus Bathyarchaeota archaeon]|nr:MFS transporter [Candidatus Bathyarchaeota archaeon]
MFQAFTSDLKLLTRYTQLFPLCFAVFVSMLGFGLVMPLLPIYARNFGATGAELGLLTASFAVARIITTFPGGMLADWAGRKIPVVLGLLAYSVVMTLYGFSEDVNQLILLRGLQGLASGIVWPVLSTMVADIAAPEDRSKAIGLYEMMWFLGSVVGPGLGGVLAGAFTVATPFFVCGTLAFASMILVAFTVKETMRNHKKPENKPAKSHSEKDSNSTLADEGGSFLVNSVSALTPYPKIFVGLCVVGLLISFSHSLIQPVLSVFANEELGISVVDVGLLFTAMGIVTLVTTLPLGTAADRTGRKITLVTGILFTAFSAVLITVSGSFWPLLLVMMMRGVGRAATNPSLTVMFTNLLPITRRGRGMGIYNGFRNVGLVVGSSVGGFLYDTMSSQTPFIICAIAGLVAVAVIIFLITEPERGLE